MTAYPCRRNARTTLSTASKDDACHSSFGKLPTQFPAQQPSVRCKICTSFLVFSLSSTHDASSFSCCSRAFDFGISIILLFIFKFVIRAIVGFRHNQQKRKQKSVSTSSAVFVGCFTRFTVVICVNVQRRHLLLLFVFFYTEILFVVSVFLYHVKHTSGDAVINHKVAVRELVA